MKRILLVDDDSSDEVALRFLLKPILEVENTEFEASHTIEEGLRKLVEWHPDVVLLDLTFPESSSDETISGILTRIAPVCCTIILTGHDGGQGLWEKCINAGAMNFLQKQYYFDAARRESLWHAIINSHLVFPHRFP